MITEDRRHDVSPDVLGAIQSAVRQAFEDNAHRCLVGFSAEDRDGLMDLKNLLKDYPAPKLRESFRLMKTIVNVRNTAGNVFVCIVFGGAFVWMLTKLFPGVTWK